MFMPGVWILWSKKKKIFVIIFQKEKGNTFTLFIIFIVKSLKKEQKSTNPLIWPPICLNKSAITPKWFNSLDTNSKWSTGNRLVHQTSQKARTLSYSSIGNQKIRKTKDSLSHYIFWWYYTPMEPSWKSSITMCHSQRPVATFNNANFALDGLVDDSFLGFFYQILRLG